MIFASGELHRPPSSGRGKGPWRGELPLLLAELSQYLKQVRLYLAAPNELLKRQLEYKAAYLYSLSQMLRSQTFDLERQAALDENARRFYHGLASVGAQLARLAELAFNVVRQQAHLSRPDFLDDYDLDDFFDKIDLGLSLIGPALSRGQLKLALRLCRLEEKLDAHYADRFSRLIAELDRGAGQPGNRVTTLMIIHYLERMGDSFLSIGEEIIYIITGQSVRYSEFKALAQGLKASGRLWPREAGLFRAIEGSRSGCRVGVISDQVGHLGNEAALFKHGPSEKVWREKQNLELWARLRPGLAPELKSFVPARPGAQAALVLEYISGPTLRDLFTERRWDKKTVALLGEALDIMAALWRETRQETEARAGFVRQIEQRLGPLTALHPELIAFRGRVGDLRIAPLSELINEARQLERNLAAPFTVRIHGDFNLSNIMHDEQSGELRFIDFYRSRLSDYAQDLSVLILSLLRLPLRGRERGRLWAGVELVWDFAQKFASAQGDERLAARLAFGLARSYLTSARFEPRRVSAARLIGYGRRLLEELISHGRGGGLWSQFELNEKTLRF